MEIHGIDMVHGAYRVSFQADGATLRGLVPETLIGDWLRQAGRPEHGDAYEYIAAHRTQIEAALIRLKNGRKVNSPYDRLSLIQET